jgi:hypothetical protein
VVIQEVIGKIVEIVQVVERIIRLKKREVVGNGSF